MSKMNSTGAGSCLRSRIDRSNAARASAWDCRLFCRPARARRYVPWSPCAYSTGGVKRCQCGLDSHPKVIEIADVEKRDRIYDFCFPDREIPSVATLHAEGANHQ